MTQSLKLLDDIVEKAQFDDAKEKAADKTKTGEGWMVHNLKVLRELIIKESKGLQ